jgi:hypothetical protein
VERKEPVCACENYEVERQRAALGGIRTHDTLQSGERSTNLTCTLFPYFLEIRLMGYLTLCCIEVTTTVGIER